MPHFQTIQQGHREGERGNKCEGARESGREHEHRRARESEQEGRARGRICPLQVAEHLELLGKQQMQKKSRQRQRQFGQSSRAQLLPPSDFAHFHNALKRR